VSECGGVYGDGVVVCALVCVVVCVVVCGGVVCVVVCGVVYGGGVVVCVLVCVLVCVVVCGVLRWTHTNVTKYIYMYTCIHTHTHTYTHAWINSHTQSPVLLALPARLERPRRRKVQ
jgi:choline-glycine betaine transporter